MRRVSIRDHVRASCAYPAHTLQLSGIPALQLFNSLQHSSIPAFQSAFALPYSVRVCKIRNVLFYRQTRSSCDPTIFLAPSERCNPRRRLGKPRVDRWAASLYSERQPVRSALFPFDTILRAAARYTSRPSCFAVKVLRTMQIIS
jgi:hypothetical protein